MEPVNISAIFLGHGQHIDSVSRCVDDWSALDPELGVIALAELIGLRNAGDAVGGIEKIYVPQRRGVASLIAVGVEGINAVVHGRNINDVVGGVRCRNQNARNIQRLRRHLSIERLREEFSELRRIDIRRSQDGFRKVLSGTRIVIVLRQHRRLAERWRNTDQRKKNRRRNDGEPANERERTAQIGRRSSAKCQGLETVAFPDELTRGHVHSEACLNWDLLDRERIGLPTLLLNLQRFGGKGKVLGAYAANSELARSTLDLKRPQRAG